MVFSGLTFLYLFLPACFLLYHVSSSPVWRNSFLLLCSLFFYAWGEPICVLLLMFSAFVDYSCSLLLDRFRQCGNAPKLFVALSLLLNLGILVVFKYSGFLVASLNQLTGLGLPVPQIALPIGISFYTFQTISYTIDVYREDVPPQRNYFKLLLYVSMFHQLVAGPIVRYSHIASEIDCRRTDIADISAGLNRFMVGLAKKVLFANSLGKLSAVYMAAPASQLSTSAAWFGLLAYTMQYYFDFSGYSDMAIGLGRMFGFHYQENFDYPFVSQSVSEYWRRWHISLGSWFKDYLFYPLMMSGGFRKLGKWSKAKLGRKAGINIPTVLALTIVWFSTGLWHGASWNYILWGGYFGLWIVLEMLFLGKLLQKLPRVLRHLYLLLIVMIGFAIFYFEDMSGLGPFLAALCGFGGGSSPTLWLSVSANLWFLLLGALLCLPVVPALRDRLTARSESMGTVLDCLRIPANVALLLLCTACLVGQTYNPFMYFRF
ncbi:MAG: MBOAT family O-acyltransferase [Angelakisella sp.]